MNESLPYSDAQSGISSKCWPIALIMHRLIIAPTTMRRTKSYTCRNVLTKANLESLIGSSYIVSFALTFKFIDTRTTLKQGQQPLINEGKTGLIAKKTRNLTHEKFDVRHSVG